MFNNMSLKFILKKLEPNNLINSKDQQVVTCEQVGADVAMDGKNGLDMLKAKLLTCCRQPYLVVFVDLNMPNMNGFEMMRALKDIQKKEKKMLEYEKSVFILATCQYEKDLDHDFKELNFTEFL